MMNVMSTLGLAVVGGALALGPQVGNNRSTMQTTPAATYEHLATAIIALRQTEDSLVRDMMTASLDRAIGALEAAAGASGGARQAHLEAAAAAITEIATEGDKSVQAVRQRLLRAGHHHHTDAETDADYIFIDSAEKKALLALAGEASRIRANASRADVLAVSQRLRSLFTRAMAAE